MLLMLLISILTPVISALQVVQRNTTLLRNSTLTSDTNYATNGRRLLRVGTDDIFHVLYLSKDRLFYSISKDKGVTWAQPELLPLPPSLSVVRTGVFNEGFTLALDSSNQPHVVFIRRYNTIFENIYKYEVWHIKKLANGGWSRPHLLFKEQCYYIGNIILEIDRAGRAHLGFTHVRNGFFGIHYFRFDPSTGKVISSSHKYIADAISFDMTLDGQGSAHVAYWYRRDYDIRVMYQYQDADTGYWSPALTVDQGCCMYFNCNPKLAVASDGEVHIVWTNQDNHYNSDMYYRTRYQNTWSTEEQATVNSLGGWASNLVLIHDAPCIVMNVFYQIGEEDYDYDVFYAYRGEKGWLGGRESISNSPDVSSLHPHAVVVGDTLCTIWTEGQAIPYTISFDQRVPQPAAP